MPAELAGLFQGVADLELGDLSSMHLVEDYFENYIDHWTTDFSGICVYALGCASYEKGNPGVGKTMLDLAYSVYPNDHIADCLEKYTGQRPEPPTTPWDSGRFEIDFRFPPAIGPTKDDVQFSSVLKALSPGQVCTLCVLGSYRSNGPYHNFLQQYRRVATFFPHTFGPLLVVTENNTKGGHWGRAESRLNDIGIEIHILHDAQGIVCEYLSPAGSPFILFIDQNREIVSQDAYSETGVWKLLEKLIQQNS